MKINIILLILFIAIIALISCNKKNNKENINTKQIENTKGQIEKGYLPGLGDFMSNIQGHHVKLWFAGIEENWILANFELNEIKENIDNIKLYCKDRDEINSLPIILPALDSMKSSLETESLIKFKSNFNNLTQTCNICHKSTNHGFIQIKIPETNPFYNQNFKKP